MDFINFDFTIGIVLNCNLHMYVIGIFYVTVKDHVTLIALFMEHQNLPFQYCLSNLKIEQSVHVYYIHKGMTAVCSPKSLSKSLIHTTNIQLTEQQIALTMARASQGVTLELVRLLPGT